MKNEVDVPSSPSFVVGTVSVDIKQHVWKKKGFSSELRSCVKEEVDVWAPLSLIVRTVSGDVKDHGRRTFLQSSGAV